MRRVTPPSDMNAPASMKNGTARKEYESTAVNIFCTTAMSGVPMTVDMVMADERPSPTPMEAPLARMTAKDERMTHNAMTRRLLLDLIRRSADDLYEILDRIQQHDETPEGNDAVNI